MDYGVGVSNRYAFLDQDVEDDLIPEVVKKVDDPKIVDAKKPSKKPSAGQGKGKQGAGTTAGPVIKGKGADAQKDQAKDPEGFETEGSSARGRGRGGSVTSRGRGGRGTGAGRSDGPEYGRDKENQSEFGSAAGNTSRGRGRGAGNRDEGRGRGGGVRRMRDSNNDGWEEPSNEPRGDRDFGYASRQRSGSSEFYSRGRGPRGGGGRGGFNRQREFDRHSGSDKSGIKPVDKREGAGARNWGTYKDEIEDVADNRNEGEESQETGKPDESGQGDVLEVEIDMELPVTEGEKQPFESTVVEEPKLMTLEEWKAQQQPRSVPSFNIRKPNEGSDASQWKNLVLKKKEKIQDDDDEYEEEDMVFPQRSGRQKRITDIGFHFGETREGGDRGFRRGGGGFRGRREGGSGREGDLEGGRESGGGRDGGRGRGGGRGGGISSRKQERVEYQPPPPKYDDVNDFPSLGGLVC